MPSAAAPNPRAGPADEIDDLFNYDAGLDETFNNSNQQPDTQTNHRGQASAHENANEQDHDQEVKVRKKRAPVAKLDEDLYVCFVPLIARLTR